MYVVYMRKNRITKKPLNANASKLLHFLNKITY